MRSGEEWKRDGEREFEQELHGEFGGRLSRGVGACREEIGYSMWHLVAAKLLEDNIQQQFLYGATNDGITANDLLDDLREGMSVFRAHHKPTNFEGSWDELVRRTAFKTPLEICVELNVPLILWDEEEGFEGKLHPVIIAAQRRSCELIGWPLDEVL